MHYFFNTFYMIERIHTKINKSRESHILLCDARIGIQTFIWISSNHIICIEKKILNNVLLIFLSSKTKKIIFYIFFLDFLKYYFCLMLLLASCFQKKKKKTGVNFSLGPMVSDCVNFKMGQLYPFLS